MLDPSNQIMYEPDAADDISERVTVRLTDGLRSRLADAAKA
jgi:hypothetical protein